MIRPSIEQRLGWRNISVVPTRPGLVYGVVVLTMLIASANYRLQLGYALSFLVVAIAIVAMLHTWRNLAGLVLRIGRCDPVFAGDIAELTLIVRNPANIERFALAFTAAGTARSEPFDAAARTERIVSIAMPTQRRGWQEAPELRLQSRFPVGLWLAWSRWRPAMRLLVYPQPDPSGSEMPSHLYTLADGPDQGAGEQDLVTLRTWRDGDSPRRIAWKAMARTASDELIVSEYEGGAPAELSFDWIALPAGWDDEQRLSRLTRWVLDADAQGLRYAMKLPGRAIAADSGSIHRAHCLEQLATWRPMQVDAQT